MRNKFAMHMFNVKLPMDFVDKINAYIDRTRVIIKIAVHGVTN